MSFGMTPTSIPGVSIRPPNSAPGAKTGPKSKKRKPSIKKLVKRPSKPKSR